MSIVKMKRLRAIGVSSDRDELLARLLSAGCVEISEPEAQLSDPEWTALLKRDSVSLSEVKAKATAATNALDAIQKYAGLKSGLFIKRNPIREADFLSDEAMNDTLARAEEINQRVRQLGRCASQCSRLAAQRETLIPWAEADLPLNLKSTEQVFLSYGVCPASADLAALSSQLVQAAPTAQLETVSSGKEQHYLVLCCHATEAEEAIAALKPFAFSQVNFKELTGTAAENIARIDGELDELNTAQETLKAELAAMAECRQALRICCDRLNGEIAKASVTDRLLTNGTVVFFEGWVPARDEETVVQILDGLGCAWALADPTDEEEPPILLQNGKMVSTMNMVTEMYALPAYRGIDPNPLIFWFFTFFYGFMFADMGYGLLMFLAGLIVTKVYHPKGTFGNIMQLGIVLGISTFICGALTGGLFGDMIPVVADVFFGKEVALPAVISPMQEPMTVLILGIAIGCFHLIFGQCIHIYLGFRDGRVKGGLDAMLDVVPWWILFAGIAVIALVGSPVLLIVGAASLVLTQGRHKEGGILKKLFGGIASLYDITSWLGDVLSYSRLMALMLATTVIASVINMLGTLPKSIIVYVVVFIVGHIFNLGINVIGTYVHAARLQYLEFFGKFYLDGGVAFKPLRYQTKYVDVLDESGKEVS